MLLFWVSQYVCLLSPLTSSRGWVGGGETSCLSTHRVLLRELPSRLFTLLRWVSVGLLLQKESRVDGLFMHSTSVTGQIHSKFACMIWIWILDKRKASDTRTPPRDWPVPHASPRSYRTAMSCWCALIREKQLAMVASARVIWLCACLRRGTGEAMGFRGLVSLCHSLYLYHMHVLWKDHVRNVDLYGNIPLLSAKKSTQIPNGWSLL